MTWGNAPRTVQTITAMLRGSWEACVSYEMPLGLAHLMDGGDHYKPAPQAVNKDVPEYSGPYYHRADAQGIGFDRTATGSNAVSQYAPEVNARLSNLATCPPELLLWFHHVPWDYRMKTGRTTWEELSFRYDDGVQYVRTMQAQWESLRGAVDPERFASVQGRLVQQLAHAVSWQTKCLQYFGSINQLPQVPEPNHATASRVQTN